MKCPTCQVSFRNSEKVCHYCGSILNLMKTPTNSESVLGYLKGRNWTSPTELGRVIWGEGHHSSSASPTCLKLVKAGMLERNQKGHYRLSEPKPADAEQPADEGSNAPNCSASSVKVARNRNLSDRLASLSEWCKSRSEGIHDTETTLTMLKKKVADIEHRVNQAGWNA